jgi:hypothetical protein
MIEDDESFKTFEKKRALQRARLMQAILIKAKLEVS